MIVKTKKHQLDKQQYIIIALKQVFREFWWAWLVPVAIMIIPIFYSPALWWCVGITIVAVIGYVLFWGAQFAAVTQMGETKTMFEKVTYEIDSRQLLVKMNAKEGYQITWDKVPKATKTKKEFLLFLNRGYFVQLPFDIFRSENDLKFFESILKRKNYVLEESFIDFVLKRKPAESTPSKVS